MKRYHALLQERTELVAEGKQMFEAAEKEARDLTDEEKKRDDEINARLEAIRGDLEREEVRRKRELEAPAADQRRATVSFMRDLAGDAPWGPDFKSGLGTFLMAVANAGSPGGRIDPRLYAGPSGASEGMPSDGGFLVRQDYSTQLLDMAIQEAVLAPMCTTIELGANSDGIDLPYIKETSRANGSRWGGVVVYRRAEADTVTASKPEFGLFDLRLEDMMGLAYATNRLLRDATAIASIFTRAFTSEMAFKLDDEIFRGTGVGSCLGFTSSAGPRVLQAKETGQAADTIVTENISKMWQKVLPRSKGQGVWFCNSECGPQFDQLALAVGAGALEPRVVSFSESGVLRIKGRPVYEIEQAAALGDEADLSFADLTQYALIRKGGIEAAQSMHVRFIYNEMAFRWVYPVNGRPLLASAVTPYKAASGATQSAFVTLAARA